MQEKIPLRDIVYHPTFNCNLTCRGCVNYSNHLETRKLPDEINWERDLDLLFDKFDVGHIEVAGGETLMFSDLSKLINKLSLAQKYTITTNGLLLYKHAWLKELIDTDPKITLSISIHYDPKIDSTYTKNLFNSIGQFLDMQPDKVKNVLCRRSISPKPNHVTSIYNNVHISFRYNEASAHAWHYPLLDKDELPIKFNNDKAAAYKSCLCPSPHLKDGKIYKCPMTAMLLKVVESKNLYDDSWQFLRDYVPYDLLGAHNQDDWNRITAPEDVCSRCPVDKSQWLTTKTDLYSKII